MKNLRLEFIPEDKESSTIALFVPLNNLNEILEKDLKNQFLKYPASWSIIDDGYDKIKCEFIPNVDSKIEMV
jgi:hypothetical protein